MAALRPHLLPMSAKHLPAAWLMVAFRHIHALGLRPGVIPILTAGAGLFTPSREFGAVCRGRRPASAARGQNSQLIAPIVAAGSGARTPRPLRMASATMRR
jgi:hypothetical protein